jgi:oligoribonuclease NrnB/cAMP/cGMP phosphodiesterase (DHH superfamily)
MNELKDKIFDIVMFHYPCQDGLASAWVVSNYHKKLNIPISLYPISHGVALTKKEPQDKTCKETETEIDIDIFVGKRLIICDYTPKLKVLEQLEKVVKSIVILDHHVTAQQALEGKTYPIFDMTRSGAGITWNYYYQESMPKFIEMIQDRDLWKWVIPGSKEFTAGFLTKCLTIEENNFDALFELFNEMYANPDKIQYYLELGKIVNTLTENKARTIGDTHKKTISEFVFEGVVYKVCVVNCFSDITSEIGNYLSRSEQIDFAALWNYNNASKDFYVSLRSTGDINVSLIAKSFGGGGHKNACGFNTKVFPPTLFDSNNYLPATLT